MPESHPSPTRRISVDIETGPNAQPPLFGLSFGSDRITLFPGKGWIQLDHFKWATRGIIEAPQSFAVHPDGAVDYNGETFHPTDAAAALALEEQLNRKHLPTTHAPPAPTRESASHHPEVHHPPFRVLLDHLSHILVEAFRGSEHTETGLRGLAHLAVDGWMRQPRSIHIDPLQRYIELDGVRFENDGDGARRLEEFLNQHFAPLPTTSSHNAIEVRENSAASTGFDIRFSIVRAGTRFEIKGHLSQEKLDLLQDHEKCDLFQPGVLLRISPPHLYIRRRNHDGTEVRLPEFPDVKYRSVTAADLERLLNHPLLRNPATLSPDQTTTTTTAANVGAQTPPSAPLPFTPPPKSPPPRANPAEPPPLANVPTPSVPLSAPVTPPATTHSPPNPPAPAIPSPFSTIDPHTTHEATFRELAGRLHFPVQDLLLSLPRVFTDRRFEILDFNGEEITSVLQLRSSHFYGFYLTHLGPEVIDLVYACHGTHIEWGTHKCAVQPTAGAESYEYRGPALLGLAQNPDQHFVFVVSSQYRDWVRPYEKACAEAFAHFLTPDEWAAQPDTFPLIWPGHP